MSLVLLSAGSTGSSRIRTLDARAVLLAGALAASVLVASGVALGYALGRPGVPAEAQARRTDAAAPMTLEKLGALSGRLFRLENMAAQLSQRIGELQKDGRTAERGRDRPRDAGKAGSGGPMLPPRLAAAGDDPASLDAQLDGLEQAIALVSEAATHRNLDLMRLPTRAPVEDSDLTSRFGNRIDPFTGRFAFHAGLDFAAEPGTPIAAAAGGVVAYAGFRPDYGWTVEIDHGNGLATRYAHAARLLVKAGTIVVPGERIATVGSSGRSTGAHLHFEVLRLGAQVDPRRYLAGL